MTQVNVPGVGAVNFPDDMSQQDIIRAIEFDILPNLRQSTEVATVQPQPAGGFGASLRSGAYGVASDLYSGVEGGANLAGLEGLAAWARRGRQENERASEEALPAAQRRSFMDAQSLGDYGNAAVQALGTSLPSSVGPLGGAIAGGALGSAVLPGPGTAIGAILGGTAAAIPQFFGSNRSAQERANPDQPVNEWAALGTAVPQAAAEAIVDRVTLGLGRFMGLGADTVGRTIMPRITRGVGMGAASEVPAEVWQQALERAQAGLDVLSPEAMREYQEAAIAAAVVGGGIGGATSGAFGARPQPESERGQDRELQGAIQQYVANREPEPEGQLLLPRETRDIETPVGNLSMSQALRYMERRFPELASIDDPQEKLRVGNYLLEREQDRRIYAQDARLVEETLGVPQADFMRAEPPQRVALVERAREEAAKQQEQGVALKTAAGASAMPRFDANINVPGANATEEEQLAFFRQRAIAQANALRAQEQQSLTQAGRAATTPSLGTSTQQTVQAQQNARARSEPLQAFDRVVEGYVQDFAKQNPTQALSVAGLQARLSQVSGKPVPLGVAREALDRYVLSRQGSGQGFVYEKDAAGRYIPVNPGATPVGVPTGPVAVARNDLPPGENAVINQGGRPLPVIATQSAPRMAPDGTQLREVAYRRTAPDGTRELVRDWVPRDALSFPPLSEQLISAAQRAGRSEASARTSGQQTTAPAAQPTAQQQADARTEAQKQVWPVIKDRLSKLQAKGRQGRVLARAVADTLKNKKLNAEQVYAAFMAADIMADLLPANADHRISFVQELTGGAEAEASGGTQGQEVQGRRVLPTKATNGLIEISLSPNVLTMLHETAAHEAFHVLQDYFGKYDPQFAALMRQGFRDGMKLSDVDPTLRRKLQSTKIPTTQKSYWSFLQEGLGDNPTTAREMQAYVFGSLSDAQRRGVPMSGLKPAYARFVNLISNFFRRMGNALKGAGFTSQMDRFMRVADEGGQRFTQSAPINETARQEASARNIGEALKAATRPDQPPIPQISSIPGIYNNAVVQATDQLAALKKADLADDARKVRQAELQTQLEDAIKNIYDLEAYPEGLDQTAKVLQDRARAALGGPIYKGNPEINTLLARTLAAEVMQALQHTEAQGKKNAKDWYTQNIRNAMAIASLLHPELSSDADAKANGFNTAAEARTVFTAAMAITSQDMDVSENAKAADYQYRYYKQNRAFDVDAVHGSKAPAISSNLALFNRLSQSNAVGGNLTTFGEFLNREFTVRELNELLSPLDVRVGGELMDQRVYGSMVFGPKIGNGFYQNLNANFEPVTIDKWLMRTWGRMTGNLIGNPELAPKQAARLLRGINNAFDARMLRPRDYATIQKQAEQVNAIAAREQRLAKDRLTDEETKLLKRLWKTYVDDGAFDGSKDQQRQLAETLNDFPVARMRELPVTLQQFSFREDMSEEEMAREIDRLTAYAGQITQWWDRVYAAAKKAKQTNEEIQATQPLFVKAAKSIRTQQSKPKDNPGGGDFRRWVREVIAETKQLLTDAGLDMSAADIQAVVWYPEKHLWKALGTRSEKELAISYQEAFERIARDAGRSQEDIDAVVRTAERDGRGAGRVDGAGAEGTAEAAGRVGGSGAEDRGERRAEASARRDPGAALIDLRRTIASGSGSNGSLWSSARASGGVERHNLTPAAEAALAKEGVVAPTLEELNAGPETARRFAEAITAAKNATPQGAAVYVYADEDYAKMRLFLSPDGQAGFALKDAGNSITDIVSVFNTRGSPYRGAAYAMIRLAVEQGGNKLDAFDTVLPLIYSANGFHVASRMSWNDEYQPDGWNKDTFRAFTNGEPDVVFMAYDPGRFEEYTGRDEGVRVEDYDEAVRIQEEAVRNPPSQRTSSDQSTDTGMSEPQVEASARALNITKEEFTNWWTGGWNPSGQRRPSVARNADGSPKRFFHGTPRSFKAFGKARSASYGNQGPFFFSADPSFAEDYAMQDLSAGGGGNLVKRGQRMLPVYLSVQNVFDSTNPERQRELMRLLDNKIAEGANLNELLPKSLKHLQEDFESGKIKTQQEMMRRAAAAWERELLDPVNSWRAIERPFVQDYIRSKGHDGFYVVEGTVKNLAVYDPRQIKSVFNSFEAGEAQRVEYSARSTSPLARNASFEQLRQELTGQDITRPSVFQAGLKGWLASLPAVRGAVGAKPGESLKSALIRTTINRAYPLWMLDELAKSQGRWTGKSAGQAMEISLMNSGRIQMLLEHGPLAYDPTTGNVSVRDDIPGLLKIMKGRVNPADKARAQTYFIALRERDLRAAGKVGFINLTPTKIASIISAAEAAHPEWRQVADDLQRMNGALLKFAVDTGTLDARKAAELEQMFYTPFYRQAEVDGEKSPDQVIGPRLSDTLTKVKSAFDVKLKGGEDPLGDLFENIIRNADTILKAGMKNVAMRTAADTMESVGLGRSATQRNPDKNTITYRVNGQDKHFEIDDPVLFTALAGAPREFTQGIYQTMSRVAGFFRDMVTSVPGFMMANLWRGKVVAYVQEGAPLLNNTIDGVKQSLMGSSSLKAFQAQTGFGGYSYGMADRDMAKAFEARLDESRSPVNLMRRAFRGLQKFSEATEMAERVKLQESLMAKGMSEKDAAFRAYMLAPFSRRGMGGGWVGSSMQWLVPLVPFLNAKVQGTYRLLEGSQGDTRSVWTLGLPKQIFLRGLLVTAASLAMAAANWDDPRWDGETVDTRMRYDIWYTPAGRILLPRGFEVGTAFGAIPVFLMDALRKQEGRDLSQGLLQAFGSTFGFNPIPQAIQPILAVIANFDWFRMRELETKGDQSLPTAERVNRNTTTAAKGVSALTGGNLSPIRAQALLDGYLGSMGTWLLGGLDSVLSAAGVIPARPAGAFGDPMSAPAIVAGVTQAGRFYRSDETAQSRFLGDYYRIKEITDQLVRSQNRAQQVGDVERLQALRGEEGLPLRLRPMVNAASTQLTQLNERIRRIELNRDYSAEEMAERLLPLRQRRDQIARRVVEAARQMGVSY